MTIILSVQNLMLNSSTSVALEKKNSSTSVYRATPFLVANSSLDRINIQTSSEKSAMVARKEAYKYQSRATWTLA